MRPICIMYDRDESYGKRFLQAVSHRQNIPFAVSLFTEESAFNEYLDKNKADIILISEELFDKDLCLKDTQCVILAEEDKPSLFLKQSLKRIYKYQSVECIIREVISCLGEAKKDSTDTNIIGVYSLYSQDLQTMFALDLAKVLSERGKTLYVNLEEFSALDEVLPSDTGKTLSDAIYYYRQAKDCVNKKVTACICNAAGVEYFLPVQCAEDVSVMGVEQFSRFLTALAKECGYMYIVVDISSAVALQWKYIKLCDTVYMMVTEEKRNIQRVQCFEKYLLLSGLEDLFNRIQKIYPPNIKAELSKDYLLDFKEKEMNKFVRELFT